MTLQEIKAAILKLDRKEQLMIVNFIQELESDLHLRESIEDVKHGRTIPAEIILNDLRRRVESGVRRHDSSWGQGDMSPNEKRSHVSALKSEQL